MIIREAVHPDPPSMVALLADDSEAARLRPARRHITTGKEFTR
jgi:hypothetical protein